jgi:hypothetical protein
MLAGPCLLAVCAGMLIAQFCLEAQSDSALVSCLYAGHPPDRPVHLQQECVD